MQRGVVHDQDLVGRAVRLRPIREPRTLHARAVCHRSLPSRAAAGIPQTEMIFLPRGRFAELLTTPAVGIRERGLGSPTSTTRCRGHDLVEGVADPEGRPCGSVVAMRAGPRACVGRSNGFRRCTFFQVSALRPGLMDVPSVEPSGACTTERQPRRRGSRRTARSGHPHHGPAQPHFHVSCPGRSAAAYGPRHPGGAPQAPQG